MRDIIVLIFVAALLFGIAIATGGCDGGDGGAADAADDVCLDASFGSIGGACESDGDCAIAGGTCLTESRGFPAGGYCTAECGRDSDCGPGAFCAEVGEAPVGGGGPPPRLCLPRCCDADPACPTGQVCGDVMLGLFPLGAPACMPGDRDAAVGDPCTGAHECAAGAACDLDRPGGYCTVAFCTPGDPDSCPDGSFCYDAEVGVTGDEHCVDSCDPAASECRSGYACVEQDGAWGCLAAS